MRNVLGLMRPSHPPQKSSLNKNSVKRRHNAFFLPPEEYSKHLDTIIQRLAGFPRAVDALLFVLSKILENPRNQSSKQVNVTKPVFHRTIGKSGEWGVRYLEALGFELVGSEYYKLLRRNEDLQKLKLGKKKLEEAQKSRLYLLEKEKLDFAKEVEVLLRDDSERETLGKQDYINRVPREPKEGSAGSTSVRVHFGGETLRRMFASDNTLEAVLHWMCASFHSSLIEKLRSGEFELIDRTVYPPKKLKISASDEDFGNESGLNLLDLLDETKRQRVEENTLQSLGLWPSGEIEIQKSGFLVKERALNGIKSKD